MQSRRPVCSQECALISDLFTCNGLQPKAAAVLKLLGMLWEPCPIWLQQLEKKKKEKENGKEKIKTNQICYRRFVTKKKKINK